MSRGFWTRVRLPPVPPYDKLDELVLVKLFLFPKLCVVEQIYATTERAVAYISGVEGSPVKSHSRPLSLGTLAPWAPCFVDSASSKATGGCFRLATRRFHQERRREYCTIFPREDCAL